MAFSSSFRDRERENRQGLAYKIDELENVGLMFIQLRDLKNRIYIAIKLL